MPEPSVVLCVAAAAMALLAVVAHLRHTDAIEQTLDTVARQLDLRLPRSGEIDGIEVDLALCQSDDTAVVRVRARIPSLDELSVEPLLGGASGQRALTWRVVSGDPALDAVALLRGESSAELVARLDPPTRRALMDLTAHGGAVREQYVVLHVPTATVDPITVVAALERVMAAARALRDGSTSDETLRQRASSDPLASVRLRALKLVLETSRDDGWLSGFADDPDPEVVLHASRARRAAGVDALRALLPGPFGVDAAVALAPWVDASEGGPLERVLLPALDRDDVIDALGRVGSVRAVAPLRARGGARATDAVRAIQARAGGEVGALSLDEGRSGALSVRKGVRELG